MSPRIPGNGGDTASRFEHVSKMLNPLTKAAWCVDHCVLILTYFIFYVKHNEPQELTFTCSLKKLAKCALWVARLFNATTSTNIM